MNRAKKLADGIEVGKEESGQDQLRLNRWAGGSTSQVCSTCRAGVWHAIIKIRINKNIINSSPVKIWRLSRWH